MEKQWHKNAGSQELVIQTPIFYTKSVKSLLTPSTIYIACKSHCQKAMEYREGHATALPFPEQPRLHA
jgi:hypothetical protein